MYSCNVISDKVYLHQLQLTLTLNTESSVEYSSRKSFWQEVFYRNAIHIHITLTSLSLRYGLHTNYRSAAVVSYPVYCIRRDLISLMNSLYLLLTQNHQLHTHRESPFDRKSFRNWNTHTYYSHIFEFEVWPSHKL